MEMMKGVAAGDERHHRLTLTGHSHTTTHTQVRKCLLSFRVFHGPGGISMNYAANVEENSRFRLTLLCENGQMKYSDGILKPSISFHFWDLSFRSKWWGFSAEQPVCGKL